MNLIYLPITIPRRPRVEFALTEKEQFFLPISNLTNRQYHKHTCSIWSFVLIRYNNNIMLKMCLNCDGFCKPCKMAQSVPNI